MRRHYGGALPRLSKRVLQNLNSQFPIGNSAYIDSMSRRFAYAASLLVLLAIVFQFQPNLGEPVGAVADIQIARSQFAQYLDDLSEPEGTFDTHNFISNETSYLHVIPELRRRVKPGFVYIGVGPDQNFSYIVHTKPSLAIITDIRRQNMLEHLLYKALFDLSNSRAEYLGLLFSREVPRGDSKTSLRELLRGIRTARATDERFRSNMTAVRNRLLQLYGLKLTAEDLRKIEYVYRTLYEEGLDLRFESIGRNNASNYPTFESLLLQTDRSGTEQGYLSSEELFQWMKRFQSENRLIPIVGDFAGPRAFKAVAGFLQKNGLMVSAFYTSNVEYYLFDGSQWRPYVANVRGLPITEDAVFIRAYFANAAGTHPQSVSGHRSTTLIQPVRDFLRDETAGRLQSYWDVVVP